MMVGIQKSLSHCHFVFSEVDGKKKAVTQPKPIKFILQRKDGAT